jgi:hypothetical protein
MLALCADFWRRKGWLGSDNRAGGLLVSHENNRLSA